MMLSAAELIRCRSSPWSVGWVERSETHHASARMETMMGFASLYPSYNPPSWSDPVNHDVLAVVNRALLQDIPRLLQHAAGCAMSDEDQADQGRKLKLRQPDLRQCGRDLARKSLAPAFACERVGNLDLVD